MISLCTWSARVYQLFYISHPVWSPAIIIIIMTHCLCRQILFPPLCRGKSEVGCTTVTPQLAESEHLADRPLQVKPGSLYCDPPDRQRAVSFAAVHLSLGYRVPAEVELPVEAAVRHVRSRHVLKCIITDHIDYGAHHGSPAVNRNANTC